MTLAELKAELHPLVAADKWQPIADLLEKYDAVVRVESERLKKMNDRMFNAYDQISQEAERLKLALSLDGGK